MCAVDAVQVLSDHATVKLQSNHWIIKAKLLAFLHQGGGVECRPDDADIGLVQRYVKRGMHTLTHPEYQIMYIEDGIAAGHELQELKIIRSTLVSGSSQTP